GDLKITDPGPQTCTFARSCTIRLTATGGRAPLRWSATGLPFGLTLDPTTGRITGTPWSTGTTRITITATDTTPTSATTTFPLTTTWF
ncbi:putative Ig domain-containing protein, partial [Streptomyces sp. NPDC006529]|uniref:putative Ig domain-containing protein n=2 Tax=Streptomyces sp. NPDC006529 TaxID=3157177 RepID=UPI0033A1C5D1